MLQFQFELWSFYMFTRCFTLYNYHLCIVILTAKQSQVTEIEFLHLNIIFSIFIAYLYIHMDLHH